MNVYEVAGVDVSAYNTRTDMQLVRWFSSMIALIYPVDVIAVLVLFFYAVEGYVVGVIGSTLDLGSFVFSFLLAMKFYGVVGKLLQSYFSLPVGFANALGFFIVAFLTEIILHILFRRVLGKIHFSFVHNAVYKKTERYFGIIPGIISGVLLLSFLFSLVVSLPSSPFLKKQIIDSHIGSYLVTKTVAFDKKFNAIFGGAVHETLNFLTVEPRSGERVTLNFQVANGKVDGQAEQEMLQVLNKERTSRGLVALVSDTALREVARAYSEDMFRRGYFSHDNPEGEDPFDRMDKAGIVYGFAGENLALAPSTSLAMEGLMNSKGHRENILRPEFRKIGIGVIDGGIYGKMYTQEFTD